MLSIPGGMNCFFHANRDEQKIVTYKGYSESIREKMQVEEAWNRLDPSLIEVEDISHGRVSGFRQQSL